MEGGKTRIYKQNPSRLIRFPDFFGITDSSGLIPLSRIWDNGIVNNGPRQTEAPAQKPPVKAEEPKSKKPSVLAKLRRYQDEDRQAMTQHRSAERDLS